MTVWKRPVERVRKLFDTLDADGNDIENVGSLNTEEINNTPATVTWGDTGELVLLASQRFSTDTTGIFDPDFSVVYGGSSGVNIPWDKTDLSNVDLKIGFSVSVNTVGDESEIALYRGDIISDSILSLGTEDSGSRHNSPLADLPENFSPTSKVDLFARCGNDEEDQVIIDKASFQIWGEIQ